MKVGLRAARRFRCWRQQALAEAAQLHRTTLTRLEQGKTAPFDVTRRRLEALLGLKAGELVCEKVAIDAGQRS